jgi:hypothetical protein
MLVKKAHEPGPEHVCWIQLNPRVFTCIDPDDYEKFSKYHWRLVRSGHCFYAARRIVKNGKTYTIKLHREIMHTLPGYECHHISHNPLDNRKSQLENLTPAEHRLKHYKL